MLVVQIKKHDCHCFAEYDGEDVMTHNKLSRSRFRSNLQILSSGNTYVHEKIGNKIKEINFSDVYFY